MKTTKGVEVKSTQRVNRSPLFKYANFEDGSHINLIKLFKPYKSGHSFGNSISSPKTAQRVRVFKTLNETENRFDELVNMAQKEKQLLKSVVTNNYTQ